MRVRARTSSPTIARFIAVALATGAATAQAQSPAQPPADTTAQSRQQSVNQLGKIKVEAEEDSSYAADAVGIGGKSARDAKQIQQSVTVITRQRILDQNLTSATEALNQATGITLVSESNYTSIFSRGFQVNNVQSDGGSPAVFNNYGSFGLPDLAAYEQVEVLRGSDGLFSGAGEAGGTVNLVRKRPLDRTQILLDLSGGNWDHYRLQVDATGALGWDGKLRGRIVAADESRDYFYDIAEQDKTVLYGVLEADVTDTTLLTVGASYEKTDSLPNFSGLPRFSTGADLGLSRDTCLCTTWSRWKTSNTELFAKAEQSLGENWTVKLNLSEQRQTMDQKYANPMGAVNPFTGTGTFLRASQYEGSPEQRMVDATLNGTFSVLGLQQELTFGANWQEYDGSGYRRYRSLYSSAPAVDVFNFNPASFPEPFVPFPDAIYREWGQEQSGFYGSLRSQITSGLHTIVGLRLSNYESRATYDFYDPQIGGAPTETANYGYKESDVVTPYGGLSYDVTEKITMYGSFSRIFKPQGTLVNVAGQSLKPITGDSAEIGAKGAWLDGTVNGSIAVYKTRRKDAAVFQRGLSGTFGDLFCCYLAAAEIASKGIDTEVSGQLLPGWQLFAGYTYNINEFRSGYGDNNGFAFEPRTPKHLLKLWTMVQLPGTLSAVRLGGGVNAQSKNFVQGEASVYDASGAEIDFVPYEYEQGAYAIVSLRGEYRIGSRWLAALNVNNLTDRRYYQTIGPSDNSNFYGEPRNFMVSLSGRW